MTETAVGERPILFSGPMVRAILDGTKTQTRRVVRFPAHVSQDNCGPMRWEEQPGAWRLAGHYGGQQLICNRTDGDVGVWAIKSPYGEPGDRLWVRETWRALECRSDGIDGMLYRADGRFVPIASREAGDRWTEAYDNGRHGTKWRPSIHMPRWASRLTLDITDVRVQRLQEISEEDAKAEGARVPDHIYPDTPREAYIYAENFRLIWDTINAKRGYGWDLNPWCWCLTFRRLP